MSATVLSARTPESALSQRRTALQQANHVRTERSRLKTDLKARRKSALDLIVDPPAWACTMEIVDLLLAMPYVGRVKALKWLRHAEISPSKQIGALTDRQRVSLIGVLMERS